MVSVHGSLRGKLKWPEGHHIWRIWFGEKKSQTVYKSLRSEINSQVMRDVGFLIINHPAAWIAFVHIFSFSFVFSSHRLKLGHVSKLLGMQMDWLCWQHIPSWNFSCIFGLWPLMLKFLAFFWVRYINLVSYHLEYQFWISFHKLILWSSSRNSLKRFLVVWFALMNFW